MRRRACVCVMDEVACVSSRRRSEVIGVRRLLLCKGNHVLDEYVGRWDLSVTVYNTHMEEKGKDVHMCRQVWLQPKRGVGCV